MRIAVISDIHGNLVALDAVLADLSLDRCDEIVCLGDAALRGPQPVECLERVRELGCPVVMGNTDEWLISDRDRDFLRSFQSKIEMALGTTDSICFFHGSPRDNTENILSITPESDMELMIEGCLATVLVGGHTHLQMLRRKYEKTIINVGSVGLPFLVGRVDAPGPRHSPVAPWAEYALLDYLDGRLSVDFRRAPIDQTALGRSTVASSMPHGKWWLSHRNWGLINCDR